MTILLGLVKLKLSNCLVRVSVNPNDKLIPLAFLTQLIADILEAGAGLPLIAFDKLATSIQKSSHVAFIAEYQNSPV